MSTPRTRLSRRLLYYRVLHFCFETIDAVFYDCSIFERPVISKYSREQRQVFLKIQIMSPIFSRKIVNQGVGNLSADEEE